MSAPLITLSYSLKDIHKAAQDFWAVASQYHLFAFSGEMGAGKTTFIHALCDHLQVEDAVSSPTFALINEYHFLDNAGKDNIIYHLDWYRLNSVEEAIHAGMEDCVLQASQKKAYCFVEWPEKAQSLLQKPYLWISIESVSEHGRVMTVKAVSA